MASLSPADRFTSEEQRLIPFLGARPSSFEIDEVEFSVIVQVKSELGTLVNEHVLEEHQIKLDIAD
jgi:hypothetical protein